jgi:hypothetical protein
MIYPFKKAGSATTDLVKDYDLKEHYPDVNMNTPWNNLSPYMRQAIRSYVVPFIGRTLYEDICNKIQAATALDDVQAEFAERLKDVCAHYGIMHMLPKKKTIVASFGAVENNAKEGTTSSIWGFKTTLWSLVQDADRMMDELLGFLQEMVEEGEVYFIENWKDEPAYSSVSSGFFRQIGDFQKYHPINNSLRTFKTLVPFMEEVSERIILPLICQEQYDRLLTAVKDNDATDAEKKLIHLVRKVVAKFTVYEAAIGLPILAEHDGFRVISNTDAIDRLAYDSEAIKTAIQGVREHAERSGNTAKADLVSFLISNQTDYPLWENSPCNKTGSETFQVVCEGPGAVML